MESPWVLLESGDGIIIAEGARERLRIQAPGPDFESFDPGDGWIGVISYDFGLPEHVDSPPPFADIPLVDLFRPKRVYRVGSSDRRIVGSSDRRIVGAQPTRSFDQPTFESAVRRALEYIRAGDIYQVNLSVAERIPLTLPPFEAYRRLLEINPSPWMGYADFGDWQLVSASPELLVEVHGNRASARPIAGTRRRTGDPSADDAMRRELRTDRKEAAEHVMLVDLARNDLGQVSRFGSVEVEAFGRIEEYSHVMHLVSDVAGRLLPGKRPFDAFRAMFPGGTITGCPKIRSMEIIAELEPVARGMYTGALGWWQGDRGQWNILIRTAVVRGGEAVIQAGAGIVADSDPGREWKESLRKAEALRLAFGAGNDVG